MLDRSILPCRPESLCSERKNPKRFARKRCIYFECDASVCCPKVCFGMAAAMSCLVHIEKNIQPPFAAVPKK